MAIKTSRRPRGNAKPGAGAAGASAKAGSTTDSRAAGLATKATLFIHQAASVLEREVAAGIRAAQSLEKRVIDVPSLRGGSPDELRQRVRKDLEEIANIAADLIVLGVRAIGDMAQRAVRITQPSAGSAKGDLRADMPTLSPEGSVQPGATAIVDMALENTGDEIWEVAGFQVSALMSSSGGRIEADRIGFAPLPLPIPPHGKAQVKISISIPGNAGPGVYSGLMMAQEMHQVRALIAVEVAESGSRAAG